MTAQQLWHAEGLEVTYLTAESLAARVWDAFATRKDLLFHGWQPSEGQAELCSPRRCHMSAGQKAWNSWQTCATQRVNWIITQRTERGKGRAWDPLRGFFGITYDNFVPVSFPPEGSGCNRSYSAFPTGNLSTLDPTMYTHTQIKYSTAIRYVYANRQS